MTWKYGLVKHEEGFKVAEVYSDGCYALLDNNDWYFETKEETVEALRRMIEDIESGN